MLLVVVVNLLESLRQKGYTRLEERNKKLLIRPNLAVHIRRESADVWEIKTDHVPGSAGRGRGRRSGRLRLPLRLRLRLLVQLPGRDFGLFAREAGANFFAAAGWGAELAGVDGEEDFGCWFGRGRCGGGGC